MVMKRFKLALTFLLILVSFSVFAQKKGLTFDLSIPLKNAKGDTLSDASVNWEAKIYEKNGFSKSLVWEESASNETSKTGILKIQIGKDGKASGAYSSFEDIKFGENKYLIYVSFVNEDISPKKLKTIKLNPVLYAMFAGKVKHAIYADTARVALSSNTDTDHDGVPDYLDKEPFSPPGAKVDKYGRAEDSDHDGVPDILDKEKDTPEGQLVNFQGISIANALSNMINSGSMGVGGASKAGGADANAGAKEGGRLPVVIFFERDFSLNQSECTLLFEVYSWLKDHPNSQCPLILLRRSPEIQP